MTDDFGLSGTRFSYHFMLCLTLVLTYANDETLESEENLRKLKSRNAQTENSSNYFSVKKRGLLFHHFLKCLLFYELRRLLALSIGFFDTIMTCASDTNCGHG
jgi:hypothetical protein